MNLPAYPRYKPSGAEWLGDVPEHWESSRLKFAVANKPFAIVDGPFGTQLKAEEYTDEGVPLIRVGDLSFVGKLSPSDFVFISPTKWVELKRSSVEPNDIVVAKTGATIGKSGLVPPEIKQALIASSCIKFSPDPRQFVPKFALYCVVSDIGQKQIKEAAGGSTRDTINIAPFGNIVFPIIPLVEQNLIVAFLDRETGRVDRLVAKKRELIQRLKEKRTALISRTVTRGLPPAAARAAGLLANPPLKPSGIEWIGDIPKHWDVKQLKWAVMFQRGHDLPTDEREEGEIPLVTSAGISATHSRAAARGPGIVTGRYGTIGEFYFVDRDYWPLNTTLYTINLRRNDARFLIYLLRHLSPLFLLNAVKSAVPGVDRNDIHSVTTAVPPLPEQAAIAAYLDLETAKLDALVGKVEEAVERLQEYRTALIAAAVTGKIDVQEETAT